MSLPKVYGGGNESVRFWITLEKTNELLVRGFNDVNENSKPEGLAILCDLTGNIQEILRDDLGVGGAERIGKPFTSLVDRADMTKALNFMVEVRSQGAAFDWQINIYANRILTTFHFAGATGPDCILVIAAKNSNGVMKLYEEMMRISNEQINELRAAFKARAELDDERNHKDRHFYDELTRLNNELANLQRELMKKNVELERLNEQKNRFLGMAAHDLRNPLGAIMMYAEFLENEAADVLDDAQMEFLSIIKSTSEFMLQMVNDLLDLAKIESGKLQLELRRHDLVALALQNTKLNRLIANRKKIELSFVCSEEPIEMLIDPGKISQVFQNLISNAIKFSFPGTAVEIEIVKSPVQVTVKVKDQGQGVPEDQLHNLFKPFRKLGVKTTGGEESTGLGLAIVRKIVEGHGGAIGVESKDGVGSEFYFTLPYTKD